MPLTSPARTLLDLAGVVREDAELERALAEAHALRLMRERELEAALRRAPGRAGVARIRRLLEADGGPVYTRSSGEQRMLALVRSAELPRPLVNVPLLGYVADFLWPDQRLVVEVDGHTFHSSRVAFERDRKRDQRLVAAGYRVIRVTWRQLWDEAYRVVARVAQALLHVP